MHDSQADYDWDPPQLRKVAKPITFPLELDVTEFCDNQLVARGGARFTLSGVIVHDGNSMHGGHYWSVHKWPAGQWVRYDDCQVVPTSEANVLRLHRKAYFLIYDAVEDSTPYSKPVFALGLCLLVVGLQGNRFSMRIQA